MREEAGILTRQKPEPAGPFLRRLDPSDASAVLSAFAADPEMQRQGAVTSLADAQLYIANLLDPAHSSVPWAIVVDGVVHGLVCVRIDADNRSGWVSYWMHPLARGGHRMRRAVTTVANWALYEGGLERLELGHRVNNPASGTVALAAGFVREGTEREKFLIRGERIDVATYGRLRTDPWPQHEPFEMR
ncbi:GNAT family N-acetyltransferase [Mycetocola sp. BIGb0189]|uniref:GNAT family N-acetyltransferase n=1 Tax=Mycetocola sp. BIGb0189 TaxID=2940604 RepID=UPI0037CA16B7